MISALGGSRVQIGGPAGAFVLLLAPIIVLHGPEALIVCALMAGVILFVLAAARLENSLRRAGQLPEVLILRMRDVLALDATGLDALEDLMEKLRKHRKELILCGPHSQPLFALTRAGFMERLGEDNVCGDMDASLARARDILQAKSSKGHRPGAT